MGRMSDLEAFLAIVEKGSQTAAASHLRRSLQSVSRSLASLERHVGVALVQRTTRRSQPTEAGLAFYARVRAAITEIDRAHTEAADLQRDLSGRLRVGAPASFGRAFVVPTVRDFLLRFPRVDVALNFADRAVDLLGAGLDVAVRIRRLPDSTLKARHLGDMRIVAFAARGYLERRGRPRHPDELARHDCVVRTVDGLDEPWSFSIDGNDRAVRVQGRFRADDATALQAAVADGLGIGVAPLWQIRERLQSGLVELVLQEFEPQRLPIHAVLPPTRTQPAKARVFVDLLAARMKLADL